MNSQPEVEGMLGPHGCLIALGVILMIVVGVFSWMVYDARPELASMSISNGTAHTIRGLRVAGAGETVAVPPIPPGKRVSVKVLWGGDDARLQSGRHGYDVSFG